MLKAFLYDHNGDVIKGLNGSAEFNVLLYPTFIKDSRKRKSNRDTSIEFETLYNQYTAELSIFPKDGFE